VGPLRDVQLKTAIAMSALPPDEERDNETKVRSPTTEPAAAKGNERWQLVQTVIAPTAEKVPEKVSDSTVLMAPPDFKETKESKAPDATPVDGSSSVRARREQVQTVPAGNIMSTAILPGPRPSRPISVESREKAMGIKRTGRRLWLWVALGGVALLAGALVLYRLLR